MDPGSPSYGTSDVSVVHCLCFTEHAVTGRLFVSCCCFVKDGEECNQVLWLTLKLIDPRY